MGKTLFQTLLKITTNFKDWMVNAAATFVANLGMPYGEKLMKAVSHMAGVRIPEHQAREILKTGRGKQVMVHRTEVREPGNQRPVYAYRLTKDCGNVAYKDFLMKVINSDEKMNEIFGPTEATAEKAGDVIELWLGLLDVAAMTKGVVNIFDDEVNPTEYLNGLEATVRFFGKTARTGQQRDSPLHVVGC